MPTNDVRAISPLVWVTNHGPVVGPGGPEDWGASNPAREQDCKSCEGDPVDVDTGALVESATDIAVAGRGVPLAFTRSYDSRRANLNGRMGYGWSDSYDWRITQDPATSVVTVQQSGGSRETFTPNAVGGFEGSPATMATLRKNSDGSWDYVLRRTLRYHFTHSGYLTSITDRNNYTTTLTYDGTRLTTVTDPTGRSLSFTYDEQDRIIKVTDPLPRTVTYSYNSSGDLTTFTNLRGFDIALGYDSAHRLVSLGDAKGRAVRNTYDELGRVIQQKDRIGYGNTTTFEYGALEADGSHQTVVRHPWFKNDRYVFKDGVTVSETRGFESSNPQTMTYTYDPLTVALTSATDGLGHTWRAEYDSRANKIRSTDPLGHRSSWTYNDLNQPVTATDAMGVTSTTTYAPNGNVLSTSTPLVGADPAAAATIQYEYGDAAHPEDATAVTDANGKTSRMTYNAHGYLTSTTDPTGRKTTTTYNILGWPLTTTTPAGNATGADPAQHTITYGPYTPSGKPEKVTDQLGNTTVYGYDWNDNPVGVTDAEGRYTLTYFDENDRPILVRRPDNTMLRHIYDHNGQLVGFKDALGHQTNYVRDGAGRVAKVLDAMGRTTVQNTYDAAGRLVTSTAPASTGNGSVVTTNTYDDANRLTGTAYSDGTPGVSYTYDDADRVTAMTDGTGTSSYTYDSLDRVTTTTTGAGKTLSYGYDLTGNVTSLTYPDGAGTVTRSHDDAGRLTGVTDWLGNTNTFSYDTDGAWSGASYGNGVQAARSHDRTGWLTNLAYTKNGNSLAGFDYQRTAAGYVAAAAPSLSGGQAADAYAYTTNGQLVSTTGPQSNQTWGYDAADRLTRLPDGTTQSYNQADELVTSNPPTGPPTSYINDQRGNRVSQTTDTATQNFTYNAANQLTTYTNPTGQTTTYTYDGTGLRATKTLPGASTPQTMTWDNITGTVPLLLSDTNAYYVYGPGDTPLEQIRPTTTGTPQVSWLHGDRLASTRILTDTTGAVTGTYSYDAYGKTLTHTGTTTTPLQHNGQYADTESGLTYLRARYYDPTTTTFLTLDPAASLSNARYAYASGNPITNTDPLGLWDILDGLESLARSAPATALVNYGRGAGAMLGISTDAIANSISSCASETVEDDSAMARGAQLFGAGTVLVAGGLTSGANAARAQGVKMLDFGMRHIKSKLNSLLVRAKQWSGREYKFGRDFRIAPLGNRTHHPKGRFPHYHRRIVDKEGQVVPGQGIGRHRPWDTKSTDTRFWDRF